MAELYQIYLITNTITNKKYVGQVIQHRGYLVRFKEHLACSKYANTRLLSNAISKYGKDAFTITLVEADIPETLINQKEMYYIDFYNTFYINGKGYNMIEGGQGVHQYHHTESTKQKIAQKSNEYWRALKLDQEKLLERNLKISNKLKGVPKSVEAKKHLSEAATKRFRTQAGTFKGRKHSNETKRLIAEKNGHPVGMYDKKSGELIRKFISVSEAGKYLIENNLTQNKSCICRIITICNHVKGQGISAYGYIWKYLK